MFEEEGDRLLREAWSYTDLTDRRQSRAGQSRVLGGRQLEGHGLRSGEDLGQDQRRCHRRHPQRYFVRARGRAVEQFQRADQLTKDDLRRVKTERRGGSREDEEDDGHDDDGNGDEARRAGSHRYRRTFPSSWQGAHHQQDRLGAVVDYRIEEVIEPKTEPRSWRLAARRRLGQESKGNRRHTCSINDGS